MGETQCAANTLIRAPSPAQGLGVAAFGSHAVAQDRIFVPCFTYRTGPFSNSGIPIANGMHDYLAMLNARDGGIGGVKIIVEECETGYKNEKGVECYEALKDRNPAVFNPYSTGITLALIRKARSIISRSSRWPTACPPRPSARISLGVQSARDLLGRLVDHLKYIGDKEGGLANLKGKTIGYIYFDGGYGLDRSRCSTSWPADYGFTVKKYPVPPADMQNQSGLWL